MIPLIIIQIARSMHKRLWFCLVVFMAAGMESHAAATYYVSLSGSDTNSGLNWDEALATISNAAAKAAGGDTVVVGTAP